MVQPEVSPVATSPAGGAGRARDTPDCSPTNAVPGRPPERIVPLLYLGTAHLALVLACILTGLWPQAVTNFSVTPG